MSGGGGRVWLGEGLTVLYEYCMCGGGVRGRVLLREGIVWIISWTYGNKLLLKVRNAAFEMMYWQSYSTEDENYGKILVNILFCLWLVHKESSEGVKLF